MGNRQNQKKDLSVIIPVFNEQESLNQLYARLKQIMEGLGKQYEIIFVDDGSSDDSFSALKGLHSGDKAVKVIQFRKNYGKASALSAGFKHAVGDVIITMDADLQDDPREIPNFLRKLEEGYDLVSGWRN